MKHQTTRFLSLLMAVIMAFSCAEVAFAADLDDATTGEEVIEDDEETEDEAEPVSDITEEEPVEEDGSDDEDEQIVESYKTNIDNGNDADVEDYSITMYAASTYDSPYSYTLGSKKTGTMSDSEQDAWYKINIPSTGTYIFTFSNNCTGGYICPYIWDEYLLDRELYNAIASGTSHGTTLTLSKGIHYLHLYVPTGSHPIGSYSFIITAESVSISKPTVSSATNTANGVKLKWKKSSNASGYYIYRKTGSGSYSKIKTINKNSTVTYTDTSSKLKNGKTYTYKVIAYSGSNKSSGATKKIVRLSRPSVKSVKSSKAKKVTVKWKKKSTVSGYQIQYSTKKSFSSKKTVTVKGKSKTSKTLSSLKKGKTYYVRMRTYKKVDGKKYYSAWTSKKSVKVKK